MTDPRTRVLYERLGEVLQDGWRDAAPWGYPHQVELALIGGVFRVQVPQASADAVVDQVMRARPHALLDDLSQIVDAGVGGIVNWLGPRWGDTNVLGVPVLRATVIHAAAQALVRAGVRTGDELRAAAVDRPDAVEKAVLDVRGLGAGTWEWIAVLAHARVRPDAQVRAFISGLIGDGDTLSSAETSELLSRTARHFATHARVLEHAVRDCIDAQAA